MDSMATANRRLCARSVEHWPEFFFRSSSSSLLHRTHSHIHICVSRGMQNEKYVNDSLLRCIDVEDVQEYGY